MKTLLFVGVGGALGSMLRYGFSGWFQRLLSPALFPYGTLAVNVLGCLAIGVLGQLAESRGVFSPETRSLVFIGFLGGFTTFSTFSNESLNLFQDGQNFDALMNLTLHIVLGLGAVWMGRSVVEWVWR